MARRSSSARAVDTTVYPTEEKVGEDLLQRWIAELLRPLVERYLAERKIRALTGADQFIYFRRGDIRGRVAPDVFVLPGVRPNRRIKSWKTWQEQIVPSFALGVVSTDVDKDYIDTPPLYDELGVKELVVFDPDHEEAVDRYRFQLFRRAGKRGLVRTVTNEDRVESLVLGCYVRAVGEGEALRLRLGVGPEGGDLYPTEAEYQRSVAEQQRSVAERERAARQSLEAEVARLRAELRARGRRPR